MGNFKKKVKKRMRLKSACCNVCILVSGLLLAYVADILLTVGDLHFIPNKNDQKCVNYGEKDWHRSSEDLKVLNSGLLGLEDGEKNANGDILFTSQDRFSWFNVGKKITKEKTLKNLVDELPRGKLVLFQNELNQFKEVHFHADNQPEHFQPHGLSFIDSKSLFVVNHQASGDTIDYIGVNKEWTRAEFFKSYGNISNTHLINDVAAVSAKEFFVTEWVEHQPGTFGNTLESFLKLRSGAVKHCLLNERSKEFDCEKVDSKLASANGVSIVREHGLLLVAETLARQILVYKISNEETKSTKLDVRPQRRSLTLQNIIFVASLCDNFNVDHVTGNVYVTCHPQGLRWKKHSEAPYNETCLSQVLKLTPDFRDFEEILVTDSFSSASVAVATKNKKTKKDSLVLGAVFIEGVAKCPLK